jgi:NAD(P)-dependent dehydrogenase (short-subunit alcohol dehydrogenase family)
VNRSAKSALHGMIHWLATTYAKKGITVNGIAPALIEQTKMLPGSNEELAKSKSHPLRSDSEMRWLRKYNRNPDWEARYAGRDCGDGSLDGEDRICDEQDHCCGWGNVSDVSWTPGVMV